MDRIKIIYILGCGRSGTTILDILLGNAKEILSVGELNNALDAWKNNLKCSCGKNIRDCEIWKNVYNESMKSIGSYNIDLSKNIITEIEKQKSIYKHFLRLFDPEVMYCYDDYNYRVFSCLTIESNTNCIVDSSKSIGRAIRLLENKKLDVRIIHIVRDPRGVYNSFQKKGLVTSVKNLKQVLLYWIGVNGFTEILKSFYPKNKFLRINYEELTDDTLDTIKRISNFVEINMDDIKRVVEKNLPMSKGHMASGNRVKDQNKPIVIKGDHIWRKNLSNREKSILYLLCFPLMILYGYKK